MRKISVFVIVVLLLGLVLVAAATPNGFNFFGRPIGGGGSSEGGRFVLDGSIGQPEAGNVSIGGDFTLSGGSRAGKLEVVNGHEVYLPMLLRP